MAMHIPRAGEEIREARDWLNKLNLSRLNNSIGQLVTASQAAIEASREQLERTERLLRDSAIETRRRDR